ncbi:MAG TPA: biopolymer transporter ExbD, partial [Alphaproteobacteria bacterium]|nr:biopolymer transporter ExbD [Alphaproteobacteria bacterium]
DADNKPIEVSISKEGKTFVGETEVEFERLVPLLSAMTQGQQDRRIYIRGDQTLDYGVIMKVIGAVNGAGFSKVALISEATP